MKEEDIRKRAVFDRYLEMVAKDIEDFFSDPSIFQRVSCPACNSVKYSKQFEKTGFSYVLCDECGTLFVNPRPPLSTLEQFYAESPSTSFWVNTFFKPVAEVRREKIFRPRAEHIRKKFQGIEEWTIGDVGAGFGIFLEELSRICPACTPVAIEPSREMVRICEAKKLRVIPYLVEEIEGWDGAFNLLTSFELFEHVYDPHRFLKKAKRLLHPGGTLFFTTLNGEGFDIQILWQNSKSISPPHHLNFFNPGSIALLLQEEGFSVEEITTPGRLDWDILEGMITNEDVDAGRFWNLFSKKGTEKAKQELQTWIAKHNFSSHMQVVARKD